MPKDNEMMQTWPTCNRPFSTGPKQLVAKAANSIKLRHLRDKARFISRWQAWSSIGWVSVLIFKSRQTYLCIYTGHQCFKVVACSNAMCSPKIVVHNCNTRTGQSKLYLRHLLEECKKGSKHHHIPIAYLCCATLC